MSYNNISAEMSDGDVQDVLTALSTIESKMPFLITLTLEERKKLLRYGDKSLAFIENTLSVAQQFPDILPASFPKDEFAKDVALLRQLTKVQFVADLTMEKMHDTKAAVGAEAMQAGLIVYELAKSAQRYNQTMKSVVEQLGQRFEALGKRPNPPEEKTEG